MVNFLGSLLIGGSLVVFFSRSPFFGIFGVLLQAIAFSSLLCIFGFPFFGLLVILIYVGGMLIIFLFSTVLSAERYPDSGWQEVVLFWSLLSVLFWPYLFNWVAQSVLDSSATLSRETGMSEVFGIFGGFTCIIAFVLLVALVIVLSFGHEQGRETLRKL
uniref:NADH-ubiquinone oxidoreductase chain 6 n=1 Tax=Silax daleus TaxID=3230861 RepID=A0AAU8HN48_9ECHI